MAECRSCEMRPTMAGSALCFWCGGTATPPDLPGPSADRRSGPPAGRTRRPGRAERAPIAPTSWLHGAVTDSRKARRRVSATAVKAAFDTAERLGLDECIVRRRKCGEGIYEVTVELPIGRLEQMLEQAAQGGDRGAQLGAADAGR